MSGGGGGGLGVLRSGLKRHLGEPALCGEYDLRPASYAPTGTPVLEDWPSVGTWLGVGVGVGMGQG